MVSVQTGDAVETDAVEPQPKPVRAQRKAERRASAETARVPWTREQAVAVAALSAAQAKCDDLAKMVAKADVARTRAMARASEVGVTHPEIGRMCDLSKGRVWQLLKAAAGS